MFKMAESNSVDHDFHEIPNMYPHLNGVPLSDHQHFKLNKIHEIKD